MSASEIAPQEFQNAELAQAQEQAMKGRLGLNVVSNYLAFALNFVLGLYLVRYLLQSLGDERLGVWSLIGSILMYLGMVDLGFGASVQKYVAEYAAQGEEDRISRLLSTTMLMFCGLGALLVVLAAVVSPLLGTVLKMSPQHVAEARIALVLMGLVQGVALPIGVIGGALTGLQRMDINNFVGAFGTVANTALVIAFVHFGFGLPGICAAYLVVMAPIAVVRYVAMKRILPRLRLSASLFDRKLVRATSTYGFTFSGLKIAHFVKYNTDGFVIAAFLSAASVTPFAIANKLATLIRQIAEQAIDVLIPVFSQLDRMEDRERIWRVYLQAGKLTVGIAAPLTLCVCLFARPILAIWLDSVPPLTETLTWILAISVFASIVPAVSVRLLLGVANHKTLAIVTLVDSVVNLLLSIALVKPYGLIGVALGTAIPLFVSHIFVFPYLGCRHIGMSTSWFLWKIFLACAVPLIPALALSLALLRSLPPTNLPVLVMEGFVVVAVYVAAFAWVSLDQQERQMYTARLRKLAPG
ncbi:MAG: oligosaccharide flippase family protein [Armatimonadetes bacterium]|nr:oligosaccharide flippase family protein [Armatimonadota bacterium]